MKLERLKRLLLLVPLARKHGAEGVPVQEALAALGLTDVETLLEDVAELTLVGSPSETPDGFVDIWVEDGRVRVFLAQGFSHPPRFTAVEGAALLAALQPFLGSGLEAAEAVARRLEEAMPMDAAVRSEAGVLARAGRLETAPAPIFRPLLEEAVRERRQVEVEYFTLASGQRSTRRLWPRAVLLHKGRWYLAAWNPAKEEEQLYRLDRMSEVRLTEETFPARPDTSPGRYELDHLYVPSGQEQEVEVRFTPKSASLAEYNWGGAAERNPDGGVTVRAHLGGDHFVLSWVLGYGGEAEIAGPARLRQQLTERVQQLQALYAEG